MFYSKHRQKSIHVGHVEIFHIYDEVENNTMSTDYVILVT